MSEQEELVLDMSHVASLAMAIWIYLIAQNEEAREIIGNLADKLKNEMDGGGSEEERTEQSVGHAENNQG
jgi:ArsR family metal-binding transcriptional regulator